MNDLSNRVIKGYELRECVGAGGFGEVYRAYQPSIGREVAVKVILPYHANHPDFIRRFEFEAQLVARLEHPHIVPLYDYWRDPDGAYLVMRWLKGSLRGAIQRGPWSVESASRLLEQMANALTVAHREGIIHRDIKPDNILLDEDENAYLADFGIAKDLSVGNTTDEGALIGSPAYITPEQIKGETITPRSDIYSLGLVMYELLASEKPYPDATTPFELMDKHLHVPIPSVTARRPNLPAALSEVLQTATAKDPAHRYANVQRFAAAFRAVIPFTQRAPSQPLPTPLTPRELDILRLMVEGLSNQQIAEKLVLALQTVRWYVKQIYDKMDVHGRHQAIERARQLNLTNQQASTVVEQVADVDMIPVRAPAVGSTSQLVNPYKGLRAFQEADAADFFGRAALTEQLLTRLSESGDGSRFLAVVGPSGSGKSSVVKAGLIPALRKGGLPNSTRWFITEMIPGTHPFEELEVALLRVSVNPLPGLLDQLAEDRRGLARAAKRVLPGDQDVELLLVIDQFEELFTLVADESVRSHFIDNLLSAVTDPRSRVRVVLTLRADFYDKPLLYPRFAELMRSHTEIIVPMTQEELERVIAGPAERIGFVLEPGLVATIIGDLAEQPGSLPLLQYALTELFDRRQGFNLTVKDYRESGGISGALARRANEIYEQLDRDRQEVARQLFLRLVTLGEGAEDTRRRVLQAELASLSKHEGLVDEVLDAFRQFRLMTFDRDPVTRGPTVEVAHEALMRTWKQLREWLDDSREDLRLQRRLTAAAAEWVNSGCDTSYLATGTRLEQFAAFASNSSLKLNRDERDYLRTSLAEHQAHEAFDEARKERELELQRRSANRLRYLAAVLFVSLFVAAGLSAFAFQSRSEAIASAATSAASVRQYQKSESLRMGNAAKQLFDADEKNAELAALLGIRALKTAYTPDAENTLVKALEILHTQRQFNGHTQNINAVAVSPDSKYVLTGSTDKTLRLWDIQTGQELRQFTGHSNTVTSVAILPDGKFALSASLDKTARLWDIRTGQELRQFTGHSAGINTLAISSDGKRLLTGSSDNTVRLWDMGTGWEMRQFAGHSDSITSVALSPNGKYVLTGSSDKTARLWDVNTGEELHSFVDSTRPDTVYYVMFSPDSRAILTSSLNNAILWDIETYNQTGSLNLAEGTIRATALSPDGNLLLLGSSDGTAWLYNVRSKRKVRSFAGHLDSITSAAFSADGKYIVTGSSDKVGRLWTIKPGMGLRNYVNWMWLGDTKVSSDAGTKLEFTPDGIQLVSTRNTPLEGLSKYGSISSISLDEKLVLAMDKMWRSSSAGHGYLYDIETNQQHTLAYKDTVGEISKVFLSDDGKYVVAIGQLNAAQVWDAHTGQALYHIRTRPGEFMTTGALSPNSKQLLVGIAGGTARLWDVQTGQELMSFTGHAENINAVTFSPDGKYILTGSSDTTIRLWDAKTGQLLREFRGHNFSVSSVAFSADGKYILTGSPDNTARLWDVQTGEELRQLSTDKAVMRAGFSEDGKYILTFDSSETGTLTIWNADYRDLIPFACNYVLRDFRDDERAKYGISDKEPTCPQFVEH